MEGDLPAKFGKAVPSVKSFSIRFRLLSALLALYSGWFFANAARPALSSGGNGVLPWMLFAGGVALAVLFFAGTPILENLVQKMNLPAGLGPAGPFKVLVIGVFLVLAALHVKICLVERVEVSGSSMAPTYESGQVIWIEKISTGVNLPRLSFPFGPITITGKLPVHGFGLFRRGQIVVFRYPGMSRHQDDYFIKRVIGMPGDRFELIGGDVYINDRLVEEPYLTPGTRTDPRPIFAQPAVHPLPLELNLLPPDVRVSALEGAGRRGTVPPHTLLVMGDNRSHSRDSRSIGFIPTFYVLGTVL